MVIAFFVLLARLPAALSLGDALTVAGGFDKLKAIDPTPSLMPRYTLWSGLIGGLFLQLSYFGADQSQVQRYLGGASLRESRLGLMFQRDFQDPDAVLHPAARRGDFVSTSSNVRRFSSTSPRGSMRRRARPATNFAASRPTTPRPTRKSKYRSTDGSPAARRRPAAAEAAHTAALAAQARGEALRADVNACCARPIHTRPGRYRLRLHHVYHRSSAARPHRSARDGVLCGYAQLEVGGT